MVTVLRRKASDNCRHRVRVVVAAKKDPGVIRQAIESMRRFRRGGVSKTRARMLRRRRT